MIPFATAAALAARPLGPLSAALAALGVALAGVYLYLSGLNAAEFAFHVFSEAPSRRPGCCPRVSDRYGLCTLPGLLLLTLRPVRSVHSCPWSGRTASPITT